jgi:hypothetical protein
MSVLKRLFLKIGFPVRIATDSFENKYYEQQARKGKQTGETLRLLSIKFQAR